jgi:hypothetical protein
MPPRYAYWTILVDGQPTAFRAAEPDELLPTLKRLQVKQPGALMKWFQRGRLWESKDEAKDKLDQGYTVGADGALVPPDATAGRGKGWRPGGDHKDPREKYQLAKKAKWQKFKQMVRSRPGHGPKPGEAGDTPVDDAPIEAGFEDPAFDNAAFGGGEFEDVTAEYLGDDGSSDADAPEPTTPDAPAAPATDWRGRPKPDGEAPPAPKRAWSGDRPKPAWRDKPGGGDRGGARPAWKPRPDARGPKPEWKSRPDARGPKPEWTPRPDARGPKPEWRDRPSGDRTGGDRPGGGRPGGDRPWSDRPKPAWRDKPGGGAGGDRGGARPAWTPRPDSRGPKPEWTPRPDARGPKPEWRDRPSGDRPGGDRPGGGRPSGDRPWSDRPKPAWRDKPGGDRPSGDRPFSDRPKPEWKGPRPEGRGPKPEWKRPGSGGGGRPYSGPKRKP